MHVIQRVLLSFTILTAGIVRGQSWKQLEDSSKYYQGNKNNSLALEFQLMTNEKLGKDSAGTLTMAANLYRTGVLYYNLAKYRDAEPYFAESGTIRKRLIGKENISYVECINHQGVIYDILGLFDKAEPLYLEALSINRRIFGESHLEYAKICNNLGTLYLSNARYKDAAVYFLKTKSVWEVTPGKEHVYYASVCNNLGVLYRNTEDYETAIAYYNESRETIRKLMGRGHPNYIMSSNNLAGLYKILGQFEKAEALYLETRENIIMNHGKDNLDYATSSSNLSDFYLAAGQYEKCEMYNTEALQKMEQVVGKENFHFISALLVCGNFNYEIGNYDKAEAVYLSAMSIMEKIGGKQNTKYIGAGIGLAMLYRSIRQFTKAEKLHIELMQIIEKTTGKEHSDYISNAHALAVLYTATGRLKEAEALLLESLLLQEKKYGTEHSWFGSISSNLGMLYSRMDSLNKARHYLYQALSNWERIMSREHPEYVKSLYFLTGLYRRAGDPKAMNRYDELFTLSELLTKRVFQFTSEKEKQNYILNRSVSLQEYLSYAVDQNDEMAWDKVYRNVLASRNIILNSSQQIRIISETSDSVLSRKYTDWVTAREQVAFWMVKPLRERRGRDSLWENKANLLEKELTLISSNFRIQQQPGWEEIRSSLRQGEAAVEFVSFRYHDSRRWTDSTFYLALIIRNDSPQPEMVKLFEQKQLDSILSLRSTSAGQHKLNQLYAVQTAAAGRKNLYNIIWKPLEGMLSGIQTVYFAPAGSLHKIAFAGLPSGNNDVLADKYRLVQLNTTASVIDRKDFSLTSREKISVFGGILYDADSITISGAVQKSYKYDVASRSLPGNLKRDAIPGFNFLMGTDKEALTISNFGRSGNFRAETYTGIEATEEAFKFLSGKNSPTVLHIATHGFFFPDPGDISKDERESGATVFRQSDNPLIRSGLALAGANNAWKGKPVTGVEDGILTAYEVSNMFLPNTKLAVLSACETGLGDIHGSEGVYGLQRAFKMAGVENLVMSLWKVPDAETAEFMQEFYKNIFTKQKISDAFYNAQTLMRNKYRKEPFKWAAWVLIR